MAVTRNTRILGQRLGLTFAGKDFWSDMSKYELSPETSDKDVVTFADAISGSSSAWKLKGTAIQSLDTGSFWEYVWTNSGKVIDAILAPHGNKVASVSQPHFKFKVKIGAKPPISSEAGDEKGATFDFEWNVEGEPEKVTTGSTLGTGNLTDALS